MWWKWWLLTKKNIIRTPLFPSHLKMSSTRNAPAERPLHLHPRPAPPRLVRHADPSHAVCPQWDHPMERIGGFGTLPAVPVKIQAAWENRKKDKKLKKVWKAIKEALAKMWKQKKKIRVTLPSLGGEVSFPPPKIYEWNYTTLYHSVQVRLEMMIDDTDQGYNEDERVEFIVYADDNPKPKTKEIGQIWYTK